MRARILDQFAKLGVPAKTYRAFTCNPWRKLSYVACATVTDIIADAIPGEGKAIVLLAHYDSVPAGPGASDDESGVATVLETVRALKARGGKSLHPVIAVITDGEEGGLLGANAFLQNDALKARVGVGRKRRSARHAGPEFAVPDEPRRRPPHRSLCKERARSLATSSLYAEIYKVLPNDTDLTLFIRAGFPSFNFAFADNVRYYHSPFDIRTNLDPATLQMQGDNMLGVASALTQTDFAALKGGNDVYHLVLRRSAAALSGELGAAAGGAYSDRPDRGGMAGRPGDRLARRIGWRDAIVAADRQWLIRLGPERSSRRSSPVIPIRLTPIPSPCVSRSVLLCGR